MEQVLEKILEPGTLLWFVGLVLGALGIIFGAISTITSRLARERTKREIAAYIAEGSMSAEQGERLLKAKEPES